MPVPFEVSDVISHKKALYCRYIDTKQWDKFNSIAHPDAQFSFFEPDGSLSHVGKTAMAFNSLDSFTKFLSRIFSNGQTLHMVGPGEIEHVRAGEVNAIWSMEEQIILRSGWLPVEVRAGGYYHETWKERDGDWFLESLILRRIYTKPSLLAWFGGLVSSYLRPKSS